jgi:general stress protein 26
MTERTVSGTREAGCELVESIEGIYIATMTTLTPDGKLHGRPMATQQAEFDGDLWFYTYKDSAKVSEIRENPQVQLGYNKDEKQTWVDVFGHAQIIEDDGKKKELWYEELRRYFPDSPEDDNVVLIKVKPDEAEIWSSSDGTGENGENVKLEFSRSKQ